MTKKEYGDCEALFILKEQLDTNLTCCARERNNRRSCDISRGEN